MENLNFNPDDVTIENDFDIIQPGIYKAVITEAELVANKTTQGSHIKIIWQLLNGSNRLLWDNITVANANVKAAQIGRENLKRICVAFGIKHLTDPAQLVGKTANIKVIVTKDKASGEDRNNIRDYKAVNAPVTEKAEAPVEAVKVSVDTDEIPWG